MRFGRRGRSQSALDVSFNPTVPLAQLRDLSMLGFIDAGEAVILHGPVGVGRSMIARALGMPHTGGADSVVFVKSSRLLADLSGGHLDRSFPHFLRHWARPAIRIRDDLGMRDFSLSQADDLYELITERAHKSAICIAKRAASDWYSLFPNPVVAESVLDRVVNSAQDVRIDGRSYRPSQ
jgi:DNA replication protein DnaC